MLLRLWAVWALTSICLTAAPVFAETPTHPRVPGFERFYAPAANPDDDEDAPKLDPVTGGRLLLGELNCTSCHAVSGDLKNVISTKQAPILDDIGSRARVDWLRDFIGKPHVTKPGTTMPDVIATLPEGDRAAAVEALVHLMASTGSISDTHPDKNSGKRGEATFQKAGCVACHPSLDGKLDNLATSVSLPELGKKYSVASLMAFLKDPLKVRPSGRMPALGLKDEEYRDIAHHFVKDVELVPNVKFAAFEGNWNDTPDFSSLKPKSTGECAGFDLTVAGREGNFGIQFQTFLKITKAGKYQFHLGSDDGSRLTIAGDVVIDNGGVHPHSEKSAAKILDVGFHPIVVDYFQGGGEWTLSLEISGNGISRQPITSFVSLEAKDPEPTARRPGFSIDPSLVAKGRGLFGALGCASCHQLKQDGKPIASELKAKTLAELNGAIGCLAENVAGKSPRFGLSPKQRASLTAALKGNAEEAPAEKLHRTLASLNCYACHKRGALGGVEEARNPYFETLQKEMGDEGRLPPLITGVGDKLRPDWLKQVLFNGADDRKNYMVVKMPKFGGNNVGLLVEPFVGLDLKPDPLPVVEFPEPEYRIKAAGRHLVGGQALSCIKCHDFGPHPSTGIRAVSLTTMDRRLRPEWVDRYLRDPQPYRPGTRMPAPWPFGMATIRDVLNADVNLQIAAVRLYLSDGDRAAIPVGLVREPMELKPVDEPIIYRNFIEGGGSRAIGVGYPEKVNLAWDANDMRLAMIWHGAFIDASRHWTGRGVGFEAPLGDHVIKLAPQAPLARLASPNDPWPTGLGRETGFRFLGYKLNGKQQPSFRYAFSGVTVEDQPVPLVKAGDLFAGLERTISLSGSSADPLFYRAAVAGKIEKISDTEYRMDGFWTMKLSGGESPVLRQAGNQWELLVPVKLVNGKATLTQTYVW
ncbi:MAG: cytochrome c1 [Planctomycetes bacterium]|nr:cytochrome c1 [Planctomycetota bacterium]